MDRWTSKNSDICRTDIGTMTTINNNDNLPDRNFFPLLSKKAYVDMYEILKEIVKLFSYRMYSSVFQPIVSVEVTILKKIWNRLDSVKEI